ncbi:hypothetical protein CABS01_11214, partial [Colletotrichum abscissum]
VPIWLRQRTSPSVIIPFFLLFGHPLRHLGSPPVVVPAYLLSRPINNVLDFRRSPIPPPQRGCRVFWALFAYRMPAVPRTSFEISKKIVLCHKHLYQ